MFFVNLIAAVWVAKWALRQILGMLLGLALVILAAIGGDPWPAVLFGGLFIAFYGLAKLAFWALGWSKPLPRGASLEELCAAERRIQEHAAGFSFSDRGLHADVRSRLSPR
jgi:hypothetical protein